MNNDYIWISLEKRRHVTPEQFQQRQDETVLRLQEAIDFNDRKKTRACLEKIMTFKTFQVIVPSDARLCSSYV